MRGSVVLLVIDPQRDYCDPSEGSLYVRGAEKDMERLASLIVRLRDRIESLFLTLDSHPHIHIAHPSFWVDKQGRQPAPFSILRVADVISGEWSPALRVASLKERAVRYATELERDRRYPLIIWPPHCIAGSVGQTISPPMQEAVRQWCLSEFAAPTFVSRGMNPFTDFHSALKADVYDPSDPTTGLNEPLITTLFEAETVLVAGQPASHTLAETLRDIARAAPDTRDLSKFVLLTDACSPVPGFEESYQQFEREMKARRMRFATTRDF